MYGMTCCVDGYIWGKHNIIADFNLADIKYYQIIVCIEVIADLDITAVIAVERLFYMNSVTRLTEKRAEDFVHFSSVIGVAVVEFVYLTLAFRTLFAQPVKPGLIGKICVHTLFHIHIVSPL